MSFYQITPDLSCYPIIGEDIIHSDPDKKSFSLAIFSFFGTLVWGESGLLHDYDRIILSSPYCKENLIVLKNKGYILCILEYIPKKKMKKFYDLIHTFYLTVLNKVSIHFFAYNDKDLIKTDKIYNGLLSYFKPQSNEFTKKSFFCGYKLHKFHPYPWFRYENEDFNIADTLKMKLYDPFETFGVYTDILYEPNNLYITCGHEFSGYEIEMESFRLTKSIHNRTLKYKFQNGINVYTISKEDLFKIESPISIGKDESFFISGSNPTFEERNLIRSKFKDFSKDVVLWYARYPYKKGETYSEYRKKFTNPLLYGEFFLRAS